MKPLTDQELDELTNEELVSLLIRLAEYAGKRFRREAEWNGSHGAPTHHNQTPS